MEIKVGTTIFLRPTGNLARHHNNEIKETKITKVGRKYFYANVYTTFGEEKFEIATLENINGDCNSAWIVYFSKQDILDEDEKNNLLGEFRVFFDWCGNGKNLTLNQLREISKIAGLSLRVGDTK